MTAVRRLPVLQSGPGPVRAGADDPVRGRRQREGARARTVFVKRLSKRTLEAEALRYPERPGIDYHRPRTWGECEAADLGTAENPCPFVSCAYHLALDVNPRTGSIKLNFPDREVWEIPATCALRVAAEGGVILEEVGRVTNLTKERIRQSEMQALRAIGADPTTRAWVGGAEPLARPNAHGVLRDDEGARIDVDLAAAQRVADLDDVMWPERGEVEP